MSNKNIAALTAATTPLAGTEEVPLWDGATKKITINNLAAGNWKVQGNTAVLQVTGLTPAAVRVMTVPDANFTVARTDADQTFTGKQAVTSAAPQQAFGHTSSTYKNYFWKDASDWSGWDTNRHPVTGTFDDVNKTNTRIECYAGNGDSYIGFGTSATNNTAATQYFRLDKNGNFVPQVAAKGINFTANTPAAGMTSQLLNWYEEGTWTPTDQSGGGLSFTVSDNKYTRIGRQVTCMALITYPTTADANSALIGGLPFAIQSYASGLANLFTIAVGTVTTVVTGTSMYVRGATGATVPNATLSTKTISVVITYFI